MGTLKYESMRKIVYIFLIVVVVTYTGFQIYELTDKGSDFDYKQFELKEILFNLIIVFVLIYQLMKTFKNEKQK